MQVKLHQPNNAPTQDEWLKFLAGCFARRVESALFVTTGRLTGAQRREAQEARVIVLEGEAEIARLARLHRIEPFVPLNGGTDGAAGDRGETEACW